MTPSQWLCVALLALLSGLSGTAASQANLKIDTPAITALRNSMRERHPQLVPLYASGAIGLMRDGNIGLHDANAVPLAQRAQANALIAATNKDLGELYREIARANGHPEWENEIRMTFAQRFGDRAQPGWYYQNADGAWLRK